MSDPTPAQSGQLELAAAQRIECLQKAADGENVRLGHAVAFMNHHMPFFGQPALRHDGDSWRQADGDAATMMDRLPANVRQGLERALLAAARFAELRFADADDVQPHEDPP